MTVFTCFHPHSSNHPEAYCSDLERILSMPGAQRDPESEQMRGWPSRRQVKWWAVVCRACRCDGPTLSGGRSALESGCSNSATQQLISLALDIARANRFCCCVWIVGSHRSDSEIFWVYIFYQTLACLSACFCQFIRIESLSPKHSPIHSTIHSPDSSPDWCQNCCWYSISQENFHPTFVETSQAAEMSKSSNALLQSQLRTVGIKSAAGLVQ